jgi:uncharacterized OsmC-like protein
MKIDIYPYLITEENEVTTRHSVEVRLDCSMAEDGSDEFVGHCIEFSVVGRRTKREAREAAIFHPSIASVLRSAIQSGCSEDVEFSEEALDKHQRMIETQDDE